MFAGLNAGSRLFNETSTSRGIEDTHPMFIEDPIRPEGPDGWPGWPARGGVEFAGVDLWLCGGITGTRKMAAIADAHHVRVVPPQPAVADRAGGLPATGRRDSDLAIQEYATGFEADMFESRPEHLGSNVVDEGLFTQISMLSRPRSLVAATLAPHRSAHGPRPAGARTAPAAAGP